MREFINEFGKENFTIIMVVVLVILAALALIIIMEKTKLRKALKKRAKKVLKSAKIIKSESSNNKEKEEREEKDSRLIRAKKLLGSKALDALRSVEQMESTIKYSEKDKVYIKPKTVPTYLTDLDSSFKSSNSSVSTSSVSRSNDFDFSDNSHKVIRKPKVEKEIFYDDIDNNTSISVDGEISKSDNVMEDIPNINNKEIPRYENLTYTNEKADVVYKETVRTPEEAREKLEEVTKKLVEDKEEVSITVFEEEQEEKSIISYDELVKASYDIDEKNDKLLEDEMGAAITLDELYKKDKKNYVKKEIKENKEIKDKETVPRRIGADIISPVYGRKKEIKDSSSFDKYSSIKDEDSEVFLEKLKNLRSKLD